MLSTSCTSGKLQVIRGIQENTEELPYNNELQVDGSKYVNTLLGIVWYLQLYQR